MRRLLSLALSLTLTHSAFASIATYDLLPEGSSSSILVRNGTSEIESHNAEQLMPPASTLKVVTALAAKLQWPNNEFRFSTELLKQDQDYVVRFSGDPSLLRKDLEALLRPLKGKTISGDLILDDSIFTGYTRGVGWPWDVLGVCYAAPVSAVSLEGNCVQASISTNEDGSSRIYVPSFQPIEVVGSVKSLTIEEQEQSFCDLELTTAPDNTYTLSGCLQKRSKPLPLKFALQSPELYVEKVIGQIFKSWNTKLEGQIRIGKTQRSAKVLASHKSAPIDELLQTMLRDSNNLYADAITKRLGHEMFDVPGSFESGTAALKLILEEKANIDLSKAVLEDGSGLSRNNRIQASSMMQIMEYIKAHNKELGLIALLPTSGENGTLKYRPSMRKEPIKGNIHGKSGSLFGTHNMVGYALDSEGKIQKTFVQFVSNYHPPKREGVEAPIVSFEKDFYKNLVEQTKK